MLWFGVVLWRRGEVGDGGVVVRGGRNSVGALDLAGEIWDSNIIESKRLLRNDGVAPLTKFFSILGSRVQKITQYLDSQER